MSRASKFFAAIASSIAALALIITNLNTIFDFWDRVVGIDDDLKIEIAEVSNVSTITWSDSVRLTGDFSYSANLLVKKTGRSRVLGCKVVAIIGKDFIFTPEKDDRDPLGRGRVETVWHYENEEKITNFQPDVSLRIECNNLFSNTVKLNFERPKS